MISECIWSGLIGTFIGIISSFGITLLKAHFETSACIKAIDTEIRSLNSICENVFDNVITDDDSILNYEYPLGTDYFTIFNANSSNIGKISDNKKRELIVSIYITAKYFLDCIRTNNHCLDEFKKIDEKYNDKNTVQYKEDIKFAMENLKHSKVNNILPAYKKLKTLLGLYLS